MRSFVEFICENEDLENYRKEAINVIHKHKDHWKKQIEDHLGTKVSKVEPHGSVLHKHKFKETSDIDILVHTHDKSKPHGPDHESSKKLSGTIHHDHTGHLDVGVFNHNP